MMRKWMSCFLVLVLALCSVQALAEDWVCPACDSSATGNFCSNCGAARPPLEWTCSNCGNVVSGNFCNNCGAAKPSSDEASEVEPSVTEMPVPSVTPQPVSTLEPIASKDAAELVASAKNHTPIREKESPDKYTYYIRDYVGKNLSTVGYTSMGGDRMEQYGNAYMELCIVSIDGRYIDIEDEDTLSQFIVVNQSVEPDTELKLEYKKDSNGEEYRNLIASQSISTIDLVVASLDGTVTGDIVNYTPTAIQVSPDKYTMYVRNYVGKNVASFGYTSMGGDRMEEYGNAYVQLCFVTLDGTYIDIEDEDLLKEYVVLGQNYSPNTEFKLTYKVDSNGKEYDNLISNQGIDLIDLQVARLDGELYGDSVEYTPVSILPSSDKYTSYVKNYVGKNLASVGYTSMGGDRMDEYGSGYIELILLTPDRSVIDIDDDEQLASYVVVKQDVDPNTEINYTYRKDSKGVEYENLIDRQNIETITLTLKEVSLIPEKEPMNITTGNELPATTAAPVTTKYSGATHSSRDFTYIVQDGDAIIVGYTGKGSSVSIPSDLDGHDIIGIGPSVFENHTEISDIVMWADPEFIDERAFMGCTKLKEISISNECERIGASAFEGCTKLKSAVLWGDPEIGARAFFGCTSLKEMSIGNDTTLIGESAFEGCTSMKSLVIWGGANIEKRAFYGCTSIKELSIDADTEYIGDYAFYGCTSLKDVTIWGHDTTIGVESFGNCPKLDEVNQW